MANTLEQLVKESNSMNGKGAMDAVGIDRNALGKLTEVVEEHDLGATPRAVLIYVRGMLQRTGQQFFDVVDDPEVFAEWKKGLPASSSISRAIPLAMAMNEHLISEGGHDETTIIDLGAGRAHASQVFLKPEILGHEFFQKARVSMDPSRMPEVDRVFAVDNRVPSWEDASQVYYGPNGNETDKVKAMKELEAMGDYDGRLIRMLEDIRTLDPKELLEVVSEKATNRVLFLNNILYAVSDGVRREIEDAVNRLAEVLDAPILQMESGNVLGIDNQVVLPGRDKPVGLPAFVRLGDNLGKMNVVAELDGNTGKPFILVKEDGRRVFVNKDGEEVAM